MNPAPDLLLASASPRRSDLLREAGYRFEVVPAAVDEAVERRPRSLADLTEANAALKAHHVAALHPDRLCIGADTLVTIDGEALGKPADLDEAFAMLQRLSGRTHQVFTGVCLARGGGAPVDARFHAVTDVTFLPLDDRSIRAYLGAIEPLDKAGSYAAQDHGELIIARTDGSYSNVVGLPMEELGGALAALGIEPRPR